MFKVIVMEIKDNYIIVMKEGGELLKIKKKGNVKIGETIFCFEDDIFYSSSNARKSKLKTWIIPIGAVAALIIILINPLINKFSPSVDNTYAVLTFDINPSIEFYLDNSGKIINVKGLNDDGKILDIEKIKGLTIEEGIIKLREMLTNENYLGNGNAVLVGFSFLGGESIQYEEMIENAVKTTFDGTNVAFMKGNEQSLVKANEQGISLGKYEAIAKLDEDGIEEAFENLSTQELLEMLKINNSNLFLNEEALDELEDELEDRLEENDDDEHEKDDESHDEDDDDLYEEQDND